MLKTDYLAGVIITVTAITCGAMTAAHAETLYQWKEADGSLTFSPAPPPEESGIEYKVLSTSGSAAADISLPETTLSASQVAGTGNAPAALTQTNQPPSAPEQNLQQLTYASDSKNALPQGISRSPQQVENNESTAAGHSTDGKTSPPPEMMASRQKSSQCGDLGKRILALENRIVISSTANEMDQAVLQISRYQKSYNAHCL